MITIICPLPSAAKGGLYSQQLSAESGVGPYTWVSEKDQGQTGLPEGITLSSTGLVGGSCSTSNTDGFYNCTFKVTDSNGQLGAMVAGITVTS